MTELEKEYEKEMCLDSMSYYLQGLHYSAGYVKWLESTITTIRTKPTWKPINEKPKEGQWLNMTKINDGNPENNSLLRPMWTYFYTFAESHHYERLVKELGITHWLPIPEAPEAHS